MFENERTFLKRENKNECGKMNTNERKEEKGSEEKKFH